MKRDMEVVRKILIALEEAPTGFAPSPLIIEGVDKKTIGYHVFLMNEAGLLVATENTDIADETPSAIPIRLTSQGHDFLELAREPKRWTKALTHAASAGALTVGILVDLLKDYAKKQLGLG